MSNIAFDLFNFRGHKISRNQYKFLCDITVAKTFHKRSENPEGEKVLVSNFLGIFFILTVPELSFLTVIF